MAGAPPVQVDGTNPETEAAIQAVQKRITEAFDIFDHESNKTVDVREVGTIMRSLNLCPSEVELTDVLTEMDEEDQSGSVRFEKFLPVMTYALMNKSYRPQTEDAILRAFKTLDVDGKGYLTKEDLEKYMTTEGEPFTPEELDEMFSVAIDQDKGVVIYKDYVPLMVVDENAA